MMCAKASVASSRLVYPPMKNDRYEIISKMLIQHGGQCMWEKDCPGGGWNTTGHRYHW